ncbi:MAG: hypothetical protein HZC28_06685 [Spirochaetes bacterium]|nr:hypothetical protein [Spirochaetota bacterium]
MAHRFFEKYEELLQKADFIKLCKRLSFQLNGVLGRDLNEVESVKQWVDIFNRTPHLNIPGYEISFNSVFIHGFNHSDKGSYPSGVEFDYLNNLTEKRELADIIFTTSFYENNNKILEKISFNQAKWGAIKRTTSSWEIDKEQLFLLTNFPRFSGANGSLIPNTDFNIEDFSRCLGSYGLMTTENFIYLSARNLQQLIGGKKTINLNDFKSIPSINAHPDYHRYYHYIPSIFSKTFCNNTYEFITDYLSGRIGEVIIGVFLQNDSARFLFHNILSAIKNLTNSQDFTRDFTEFLNKYGDFNENDNLTNVEYKFSENLGIVQLKIKIDKEKGIE